ncbi:hypothetical protein BKA81DRAFT_363962 [Phyllosticta paracitricarpa]|uniref:Uncharacterized protein n=1 Tax=Phyllosticta paracitricarpa TaxID=2016321 RepID=A0ABR1MZ79_9PEZI
MPNIIVLGTCDTKLPELLYLRDQILRHTDTTVTLIDVGREHVEHVAITMPQSLLVSQYGRNAPISELSRGELNRYMATCASDAVRALVEQPTGRMGAPHGIVSLGGSGGTSLAAAVMRDSLPLGFPKLIASTIASGDTGSIVGEADITLMYSVVDVAGLNGLLKNILSNAAGAIVGMAGAYQQMLQEKREMNGETNGAKRKKVRVGITMFGVTTAACTAMNAHLAACQDIDFEVFVFHATGHGGRAMERLIEEGGLDAIIDLTTTEVCDYICGGNMSAGPKRLEAAIKAEIPLVVSVGATDMANFGSLDSVPERYRSRKLHEHNPSVTLMRTNAEEARAVGTFIADKLKVHQKASVVEVWLPNGGVSALSEAGGPFEDSHVDAALFSAVEQGLQGTSIRVVSDDRAINDKSFAVDVAEALVRMVNILNNVQRAGG